MSAELETALRAAVEPSIVTLAHKEEVVFDILQFVDKFRSIWLYQDNYLEHPINYSFCTGSFYLLMYKNLSVTNIWPSEVLALLRTYSFFSPNNDDIPHNAPVSFFSDADYSSFLLNLFRSTAAAFSLEARCKAPNQSSLNDTRQTFIDDITKYLIPNIIDNYTLILESTIIVNVYFTSCLVHVPRSRRLDLRRIISESGYIHPGGAAIYTRKVDKADHASLEARLTLFLNPNGHRAYSQPVFITPYADDFFTPHDRLSPVSLRNGLEEVKIRVRRHFIAVTPLIDYLSTLPTNPEFKDILYVPPGIKDFKDERADALTTTENHLTIWFVIDRALADVQISNRTVGTETDVYLFVYEQAYMNDDQLILFKERKPGWYASITAPHTISISLTNIVRDGFLSHKGTGERPIVILDPFFGTGTMMLDMALRLDNAVIVGFDRNPAAIQATKDNIEFFSLGANEVSSLSDLIRGGVAALKESSSYSRKSVFKASVGTSPPTDDGPTSAISAYVLGQIWEKIFCCDESNPSGKIAATINHGFESTIYSEVLNFSGSYEVRFLFYVLWRVIALGTFSIRNNFGNVQLVMLNELDNVDREFKHLCRTLNGSEKRFRGIPIFTLLKIFDFTQMRYL